MKLLYWIQNAMRTLLISLIIGLSIAAFAQTDSTKNNLERYKQLYEQGLISEQEYEALKSKDSIRNSSDEVDVSDENKYTWTNLINCVPYWVFENAIKKLTEGAT